MVIDLVWWFPQAPTIMPIYRDGVKAAMEVLERRGHTVRWHLGVEPNVPQDSDFILVWDNSVSPFLQQLKNYKCRKGLILTTEMYVNIDALRNYDVIFAEAQPVVDIVKPNGIRVIKAFGTDTKFFSPSPRERKYKWFYPATFNPWKRQDIFSDLHGKDGLCIGTVQPDGWDIYWHCVDGGTQVITGYLPVEILKEFYDMSENVHITGYEGSGRTVIESMSMGLPVTCAADNVKCSSYIKEFKESGLEPREFVLKYYSEEVYADNLLKGILNA